MIECRIDGVVVPLRGEGIKMPTYDSTKLHSVEEWRKGEEVVVEVESSPDADRALSFAFDINRGKNFNDEKHTASLWVDGVELFSGVAALLSTERDADGQYYRLRIRSGGGEWADMAALTQLRESGLSVDMALIPSNIEASWQGDAAVRFLPLRHDSYPKPKQQSAWLSQHVLMPNDYHPFISVKHLIRSIAERSGYTIRSKWLDSDIASRLMISGAYKGVRVEAAERDMGFKAYRTYEHTAEANNLGYVFATEPKHSSSVGAIVDSVSAEAVGSDGELFSDSYNHGAFRIENNSPCFTPTRDIAVAFEYFIRYITDYRIESSRRLKGFDRVRLGLGCDVDIVLENDFEDMRNSVEPNMAYKLLIFDYDASASYRLNGIGDVQGAECSVVTPSECRGSTQLMVKNKNSGKYVRYGGDWALYEGHVETTGRREVEFTLRTPYQHLTQSSRHLFDDVMFYGAEPGQKITLRSGCSLRPIFGGGLGYGERVSFEDVANHAISQQQLLEALAHMFNLCFFTHEELKLLIIEPYDDIFRTDVVDWSGRQMGDELTLVEGSPNEFEHVRLEYAGSDGVVVRDNLSSGDEMGVWAMSRGGYATKRGVDVRANPLFRPTVSLGGFSADAPSAEVLTVGDRDDVETSSYVEPRIVLYNGLAELAEGEHWSSNSNPHLYPHASFHSSLSDKTLCFEDRDGREGLHRYYDTELMEAERGDVRCNIYITAHEYVALFDPNTSEASLLSLFRLRIEGGEALFRLRRIESYDPRKGVATCLFRRMLRDK